MKEAQIILIEDNPADVLLFEMALQENGIGYHLTRFENGEEAVRVLCAPDQQDSVLPDAILLDLNTPRSDGFEVLVSLKQCTRLSRVPIAILTSSQATSDKHRTALHHVRFIQKPSHLDDFFETVGRAVQEMLHA